MQEPPGYAHSPARIVIASNLHLLLTCLICALLVCLTGPVWFVLCLVFILLPEYRVMSRHGVDCYYYGKTCAFGKGRLSCTVFPKGEPERFSRKTMIWKETIPDFQVLFIPLLAGVVLLLIGFRWTILPLIILILIPGFPGNAYVRG